MSTGKLHTHGHGDHDHSHDHHGHHHDHSHDHGHHHHHDDPKHDDHGIDHVFGQDKPRKGEGRTLVVVVVTAVMMVVEIVGGVVFGSMALLADGLHMASHAVALTVTLAAYVLARKYAADRRFSFGTGKINSLAGFASAVLLAGFAAVMVIESVQRLLSPVAIQFDQALIVAVVGLVVNGASALLLGHGHDHDHGHAHGHVHGSVHDHPHGHVHGHDHNLRAAYLHVLADAMTSVLAIVALLAGKMAGWVWLDPVMGVVGAALVAHWSWGLVKVTGAVLLDRQVDAHELDEIRAAVEQTPGARVLDLHVWAIAPGMHAAEIVVENATAAQVRAALPHDVNIVHAVIETRPTPAD